jgi:hypothetical protein
VIGLLLVGSALASAVLFALAARLTSLASTLLAVYLAFTGNLGLTTIALSPLHAVTRTWLGVAEAVLLAAALVLWWLRGRPTPPLAPARKAVLEVVSDLPTALFLVFVLVLLGYELLLGLTVPPNNIDAISYHLSKAAAWAQHGGLYWIPDAPSARMDAFQPFAEQQLLFLLVAVHGGRLVEMPQFVAELAILVAVYGSARRLGFAVRPAACAAFLLATFSLFALESTTAQNDLVAASFPAVAACLLLGPGRLEPLLGGAAAGIALGVKLTTGLVFPVLIWLALRTGPRRFAAAVAGGVAGFVVLGMWGYVLNLAETGHVLGVGTGLLEDRASPSYPGSLVNGLDLLYGLMDLSVLSNHLIHVSAVVGVVAAVAVAAWIVRSKRKLLLALLEGARVALPFLAGLLVLGGAALIADATRPLGYPLRGPGGMLGPLDASLGHTYTRISNGDYSGLGPLGIVALLASIVVAISAVVRRRADMRHLILACGFPCFLVLLSLTTGFTPLLVRFFVVPAALVAPLLAWLFRGWATTVAYGVVAAVTVSLTVVHDQAKPLSSPNGLGRPWQLSVSDALRTNSLPVAATEVTGLDRALPAGCVGVIVRESDPNYFLYGSHLQRHVIYLPQENAQPVVYAKGLSHVVVNTDINPAFVHQITSGLTAAKWTVRSIGGSWLYASTKLPSLCG